MYRPHRPTDGVEIIGAIDIEPPLDPDDVDRLLAINLASTEAVLGERSSSVVDQLAPEHPDGPSSWIACERGCCLEIAEHSIARLEAFEPWLDYLVRAQLTSHQFAGAVMIRDCADGTFRALVVDGGRVRTKGIPTHRRPRSRQAEEGGDRHLQGV